MKQVTLLFLLPVMAFGAGWVNPRSLEPDQTEVYLTVDGQPLELHIFYPDSVKPVEARPGILFFHGGGFSKGNPGAFYYACEYLASRGMVAISAQYRLRDKDKGYTQQTCLKDAKSAMRYVYENAAQFAIDPNRIAAAGGSAGGHLAAALATSTLINNESDDATISTVPKALVLFNPILGMTLNKFIDESIAMDFSPFHGAHAGIPPTLAMWGDEDKFMKVSQIEEYQQKLEDLGVSIEVEIYPGQKHSFFDNSQEWVVITLTRVDQFLESVGLLEGAPTAESWASETAR